MGYGYVIVRREQRDYTQYLATYGDMYGDMSDSRKRAEVVLSLRRRDAISLAAARRIEWMQITGMETEDIRHAINVKRYQIDQCERPWNVKNCDIRTFRMLMTELRRRESR